MEVNLRQSPLSHIAMLHLQSLEHAELGASQFYTQESNRNSKTETLSLLSLKIIVSQCRERQSHAQSLNPHWTAQEQAWSLKSPHSPCRPHLGVSFSVLGLMCTPLFCLSTGVNGPQAHPQLPVFRLPRWRGWGPPRTVRSGGVQLPRLPRLQGGAPGPQGPIESQAAGLAHSPLSHCTFSVLSNTES